MGNAVKKGEELSENMGSNKLVRVFSEAEKRGHEEVAFFHFPKVGLKAIVAIHNTVLGPALGGCRMRLYEDESQALEDAMRLAEGMTYKSSLAGLDLGGGKSVLIADPHMKAGRTELFERFAHCLNRLNGSYITAEDMGTSVEDVMTMRKFTKFAAGFSLDQGGGGDPSPWTALGTFRGMQAAAERKWGTKDLKGKKISLQGVGHVGVFLIEHLIEAGAEIIATDTNELQLEKVRQQFGVQAVKPDEIYDVDCDIYSPNAIGQTINSNTITRLKCSVIAGAANNQLIDSSMYAAIDERKMVYCPDFAINAGGVISVGGEYNPGGWNRDWVTKKVENIYNTIHMVLEASEKRGRFPEVVAVELAKERVQKAEEQGKGLK